MSILTSTLTPKERIQGSKEWHLARQKRITASNAPVIMGESKWQTPYGLYLEKVGPLNISTPNYQQQRGLDMEPKARDWFFDHTGYDLKPDVLIDPEFPWLMGSFDGIDMSKGVALEIKAPGKIDHSLAKCGDIPEHYKAQLDHLLAVSQLDMIYYLSYDGEDGVILEYARDEKRIDALIEKELDFLKCMETLTPPPLTDKDVIKRDDKEWADAVDEYKAIKSSLKYFEERESQLRDRLIRLSNDHCSEGAGIRLTKYVKAGTVNYSIIPELKGVMVDKYRKPPSTCWRIGEV